MFYLRTTFREHVVMDVEVMRCKGHLHGVNIDGVIGNLNFVNNFNLNGIIFCGLFCCFLVTLHDNMVMIWPGALGNWTETGEK